MFKNFWFYFNLIPFILGIIIFFNIPKEATYQEAFSFCKNNYQLETKIGQCINEFWYYNQIEHIGLSTLSIYGLVFIIPLSIYLLLSWRKHRYGHY